MRIITYEDAILEAIAEEMRNDARIFHLSTDAPQPLVKEFGTARVRSAPIAESALTGMAIGAAGSGYRPIIDWRSVTFSFVAMDQIVNQVSKIHYMYGGQKSFPIVFRTKVGGGTRRAAQHSQSPYSMFMNLAGLKLLLPSTPYDVKGLLKTAIRDNNPVIVFESERLANYRGNVPDNDYCIAIGDADIKRPGSDVTIVALAWLVHEALEAATELAELGISAEVIDPRSLAPMDKKTLCQSVQKTGRLVVADEAGPTAGASAEIISIVTEDGPTFRTLKCPVRRVCALPVPVPYSPSLEDHVFPDKTQIIDAVIEMMGDTYPT